MSWPLFLKNECCGILSAVLFEKAYCEYRLNRVESALKTIENAPEQTDKLKELYGQVVSQCYLLMLNLFPRLKHYCNIYYVLSLISCTDWSAMTSASLSTLI